MKNCVLPAILSSPCLSPIKNMHRYKHNVFIHKPFTTLGGKQIKTGEKKTQQQQQNPQTITSQCESAMVLSTFFSPGIFIVP